MESPPTKFTFIHEAAPGVSLSDRARASVEESGILTTIPIDKPCERLDNRFWPQTRSLCGPAGKPAPSAIKPRFRHGWEEGQRERKHTQKDATTSAFDADKWKRRSRRWSAARKDAG
jgi:hypothetical protein